MQIDVLTIFPQIFDGFLGESLVAKGIAKNIFSVNVRDIRAFAENKHKKVDDAPFGGGAGMVMSPQPLADAIDSIKKEGPCRTILLTPRGRPFTQKIARELSGEKKLVLVCGRYEGVDERIVRHWVDEEISLGDFVLNGGEVAAMAVIEAVFRLLPGAVGCQDSTGEESFEKGLLEYPHYTRPENFRGLPVPAELLSGHHKNIEKWRFEQSVKKTGEVRPDMLEKRPEQWKKIKFSIALVHYPVANKDGGEMVSSITTLDAHDLARIGRTYGAERAYMVTPVLEQARLVARIMKHWKDDDAVKKADGRKSLAVDVLRTAGSIDDMVEDAKRRSKRVKLLATSATRTERSVSPQVWRNLAAEGDDEWIILFGTAHGLGRSLVERADSVLLPVEGGGEFNHLPVRGASAIILDRLFGRTE
ncbi:MAG: tRNA (guanosine(37)-N1)-methyltransferase TrmD [Nitrospinae bacterium]|nr:tRNA (guanosine(37)-N1)-methyltransferase TrmD [Nitrospinota bacterium]